MFTDQTDIHKLKLYLNNLFLILASTQYEVYETNNLNISKLEIPLELNRSIQDNSKNTSDQDNCKYSVNSVCTPDANDVNYSVLNMCFPCIQKSDTGMKNVPNEWVSAAPDQETEKNKVPYILVPGTPDQGSDKNSVSNVWSLGTPEQDTKKNHEPHLCFPSSPDQNTKKNNVPNVCSPCFVNVESNLESSDPVPSYNPSDAEVKILKQEAEKLLNIKEINKANDHESETVIENRKPTDTNNSEKTEKHEVLSFTGLIREIDPQKGPEIKTFESRSLPGDIHGIQTKP